MLIIGENFFILRNFKYNKKIPMRIRNPTYKLFNKNYATLKQDTEFNNRIVYLPSLANMGIPTNLPIWIFSFKPIITYIHRRSGSIFNPILKMK